MSSKYYNWQATFSRQTGTQGEICIVTGAKNIGKTFGLRLQCVNDYLKTGRHFCEICRTKDEVKNVTQGYFDKLQNAGYFNDYVFKVERNTGYIAEKPQPGDKPEWQVICYFVALTAFQTEKKRTYTDVYRFIFDEAIIDRKDRYHRYLPNEFLVLANILDSVSRQQYDNAKPYKVYILGNACDLSCPYLQYLGINTIPEYGYHFYRHKTVLFHYVEPWDVQERQINTLVGRMLEGNEESEMVFENLFADTSNGEVEKKSPNARYAFAIRYRKTTFAVWIDHKAGIFYITRKLPKDAQNVMTITKDDASVDYKRLKRTDPYLQALNDIFYLGGLRYDSIALREQFLQVLGYLGVK